MSENYYSVSNNYPSIFIPIMERVQYFVCKELLYYDDDYSNPHEKFILAEQTDDAFRLSKKSFRKTNFTIPFTAYNISDIELDTERLNVNAKLGLYYSHGYSALIDSTASILNIPMMSVFNKFKDYLRAFTILNSASVDNRKISVPCTVNDIETAFYVYLEMDVTKGPYASELQEHLSKGKINTIQHDLRVYFHNPILDTGIYPVDDIIVSLDSYVNDDYRDSTTIQSGVVASTPTISSTSPVSGAVDVSVDSNITLNFSVAMNEDITNDNFSVDPLFLYETTWNDSSTIVVINPHEDLTSGIAQTITAYAEVESADGINMEEDYTFTLYTES